MVLGRPEVDQLDEIVIVGHGHHAHLRAPVRLGARRAGQQEFNYDLIDQTYRGAQPRTAVNVCAGQTG